MFKSIIKGGAKLALKLVPNGVLASLIAELLTDAMKKGVKNKEKCAKVCDACSESGKALTTFSDAARDCEFTEDEIENCTAATKSAVEKIIEAAK